MAWDWDYIGTHQGEFTRYGAPAGAGSVPQLAYPQLSRELLRRAKPDWIYRKYVNKVTDYGRGQGEYILFNRFLNDYRERWTVLNEFDAVPNHNISVKRFSIRVAEKGGAFPLTERLQLMATFDPKAIIDQYLRDYTTSNIDQDILFNSLVYSDIWVKKTTGGLVIEEGKGLTDKTFATDSGAPISVTAVNVTSDTADDITVRDILRIKSEMIRRRMMKHSSAVIVNTTFVEKVFADTSFFQIVAYSRPERFEEGELGTVFGFRFVVDNTGYLENVLDQINGNSPRKFNTIAIFLAEDGHREAIALPEEVRTDTPLELGRFTRVGVITYRGESPIWFSADTDVPAPRPSGGIVLIGK